jgi:Ni,Fe-hydrogenase III small subunit
MLKTLATIAACGRVSEPPPDADQALRISVALHEQILSILGRALCIRHIDAGSCNGCELEIHALNNPVYNLDGLGIRFVASPRHADLLLVTGPVSRNMENALLRTYAATPDPKLVVAVGDCGCTGGIFGENLCQSRARGKRSASGRGRSGLSANADPTASGHSGGNHHRPPGFAALPRAVRPGPILVVEVDSAAAQTLTAALLDRLLRHAHIVQISGRAAA